MATAMLSALLLAAGGLMAQEPEPGAPILPGTRAPGQPVPLPAGLPPVVYPFPSLQLLIGSDFLAVQSDDPEFEANPGSPFSTGAVFGLSWVGENWRVGYLRRIYRHALPSGTAIEGTFVDFIGIDSDALSAHGGFRPWKPVFLGAGLSAQRRRLEFLPSDADAASSRGETEAVLSGEGLIELAFALPFAFQARYARDLNAPRVELNGWTLLIAYTIPL